LLVGASIARKKRKSSEISRLQKRKKFFLAFFMGQAWIFRNWPSRSGCKTAYFVTLDFVSGKDGVLIFFNYWKYIAFCVALTSSMVCVCFSQSTLYGVLKPNNVREVNTSVEALILYVLLKNNYLKFCFDKP
jgi:hypothetical protein